jgi:zinc transporter ZupT
MVNNGMARVKILLYILTLGFITPIGTIVGIVLTLNSSEAVGQPQSIVVGVLQVNNCPIVSPLDLSQHIGGFIT